MAELKNTVLITGASGFVGAGLARYLLKNQYTVYLLLRDNSNLWRLKDLLDDENLKIIRGDLLNYSSYKNSLAGINFKYIFHLATYGAYPSVQQDEETILKTNIFSTVELLNTFKDVNYDCFVNVGSSSEYGVSKKEMSEDDMPKPTNVYGVSKLSAANYCSYYANKFNKPVVHVRLFSVYGLFEEKIRFFPQLMLHLVKDNSFNLTSGEQGRDFIYLDDAVEGLLRIAMCGKSLSGEIINLGTGKQTSIKEFALTAKKTLSSNSELVFGSLSQREGETYFWVANTSKLEKYLGWKPEITIEMGILKSKDWFENSGDYYDV